MSSERENMIEYFSERLKEERLMGHSLSATDFRDLQRYMSSEIGLSDDSLLPSRALLVHEYATLEYAGSTFKSLHTRYIEPYSHSNLSTLGLRRVFAVL